MNLDANAKRPSRTHIARRPRASSNRAIESVNKDKLGTIRSELADIIVRHLDGAPERKTSVPGLSIHGVDRPTLPSSYIYEPCFAMIAYGTKKVVAGTETYVYDETHFLLTAVGLPTIVQVVEANATRPYLSVKLNLDLELARDLIADLDEVGSPERSSPSGMAIAPVSQQIATTTLRIANLLDEPHDIPILAPSLHRELLYRILTGPAGGRLRRVVHEGTGLNRVDAAVRYIREHFRSSFSSKALAQEIGMTESTLNRHFRMVTAMSPLQYQKMLRLHEARHLMLAQQVNAGEAAYQVGYESATQFNREYKRQFGSAPRKDIDILLKAAYSMSS